MENNDNPPKEQEEKSPQQVKLPPTYRWLAWLLAALVLLFLAGSVYLWLQLASAKKSVESLNKEKQQLQAQLNAQDKKDANANDEQVACTYTPSADFKENIKAALDSKNTAAFSTYTTNPVKYVLAASEMGGNRTPDQAASDLEYTHSATGPWDFNLPQATIDGYDASFYTDYFGDHTLVGKAASGMVVAFDFNCDGSDINQIFVAASEDLLQD